MGSNPTLPAKEETMTDIKLGPKDAALVVSSAGTYEMFFPEQNPDDPISDSAATVAMLALAVKDPDILKKMQELFTKMAQEFEESEEEQCAGNAS